MSQSTNEIFRDAERAKAQGNPHEGAEIFESSNTKESRGCSIIQPFSATIRGNIPGLDETQGGKGILFGANIREMDHMLQERRSRNEPYH